MCLEMKVKDCAVDPLSNLPILILRDEHDKRSLPIWVGLAEANAIAIELEKIPTARPMTHDLIKSILESLRARVVKVVVNDLRDNTFFAVLHLQLGRQRDHGGLAPVRRHRARPARGRPHLRGGRGGAKSPDGGSGQRGRGRGAGGPKIRTR